MGLPTITTTANGAHENMTEDRHGYVLSDPSDATALAGMMRRLLDEGRRRAMSRACIDLRPRLSYGGHLDQLEDLYRQILNPSRRAKMRILAEHSSPS